MPDLRIKFSPTQKRVILKVVDENEVLASFSLKAKKTLDGNIMVYDHKDVDIILMPEKKKIVTFKKEGSPGDSAYGASDRMFKYLGSRGLIDLNSIQGGNVLGSYEATIPDSNIQITNKIVLLGVSKWMEKERPYFEYGEDYEDLTQNRLLEPDDQESTELGEVPQDTSKGSIVPGYYRSPYWMSYILEQVED